MSRPSAAEMLDCAVGGRLDKPAPGRSDAPALDDSCKKNAKTKIAEGDTGDHAALAGSGY